MQKTMKKTLILLMFIILVLIIHYFPVISIYSQMVSVKLNYYFDDNINYLSLTPIESDDALLTTCSYELYSKHTFDGINLLVPVYSENVKIKKHEIPFSLSVSSGKLIPVIHSSISNEIYSISNYEYPELNQELSSLLQLNKFDTLKDILSVTPEKLSVFSGLEIQYLNNIKLNIKKGLLLPETKSILEFGDGDDINSILVLVDDYHFFAFVYDLYSTNMYKIAFHGLARHKVDCILKSIRSELPQIQRRQIYLKS